MKREYKDNEQAIDVAKEAVWLAYQAAGGTSGYGFLRKNDSADKNAVWDNAYNMGDYSGRGSMQEGRVNADYVFGRMLKLRFDVKDNTITFDDYPPRGDYQSWCYEYKTFPALFDAALANVEKLAA